MASGSPRVAAHVFVTSTGVALPRWLEAFPNAQVVACDAINTIAPSARLIWLRLKPDSVPLEQLEQLRRFVAAVPVVVLSDQPNDNEALALFAAGIRGYCNAHATMANLRQVAKVVLEGGLWVGESLMQRLLRASGAAAARTPAKLLLDVAAGAAVSRLSNLTAREREVAQAIATGASNKEIARQMNITLRTVKAHSGAIFDKLQVRDRLQLALVVNAGNIS
ncbi:MAG: response regulator transcription factor [Pseudomonadota bacterium]